MKKLIIIIAVVFSFGYATRTIAVQTTNSTVSNLKMVPVAQKSVDSTKNVGVQTDGHALDSKVLANDFDEIVSILGCGKNLNDPRLFEEVRALDCALTTIDSGINGLPSVYVKIRLVLKLAVRAAKNMAEWRKASPEKQKEIIATNIRELIRPLEQFLNLIKTFSFVIEPIITASLLVLKNERPLLRHIDVLADSYLWNAFTQNQEDIANQLTRNVTTIDNLYNVLKELVTLFDDLLASLSPETVANGLQAEQEIRNAAAQAQAAKAARGA